MGEEHRLHSALVTTVIARLLPLMDKSGSVCVIILLKRNGYQIRPFDRSRSYPKKPMKPEALLGWCVNPVRHRTDVRREQSMSWKGSEPTFSAS